MESNNTSKSTNGNIDSDNSEFLAIIEVPTLAPAGFQTSTITGLVMESGKKEDGTPTKTLKLTGELDATDNADTKFPIEKRYNLMENGRGKAQFLKDAGVILGRKLSENDLVHFNKATVIGQKVLCEIKHSKKGKNWEVGVGDFKAIAKKAAAQN
jgi:hypothetical protein